MRLSHTQNQQTRRSIEPIEQSSSASNLVLQPDYSGDRKPWKCRKCHGSSCPLIYLFHQEAELRPSRLVLRISRSLQDLSHYLCACHPILLYSPS